ncbi:DUF1684 domain-containing protein [Zhihengliuella sp.]|uniref:DUF1684 domain-containing protein n=1 Tax=Zhihengliuella sp. TaxID=1954483 RepID=UPI00281220DA|nr:DUF1684 domain-containing protein [Zhihengliuella sp.]
MAQDATAQDSTLPSPSPARTAWQQWRMLREESLAAEFGWLTLTSYQWLPSAPAPVELVPGRFGAGPDGAVFEPDGAEVLGCDDDAPVTAPLTRALAEGESVDWLRTRDVTGQDTVVELGVRGGRYMVRTHARRSPQLDAFDGVPTFDYNPAWVVPGRFEAYPEPRPVEVGTYRPDTRLDKVLAGEVVFEMPAAFPHRLAAEQNPDGSLAIAFHDASNGDTTPEWRFVTVPAPGPDGTVTLDFNRTLFYPFAFSQFAVCPRPPEGNRLEIAVNAGERSERPAPTGGFATGGNPTGVSTTGGPATGGNPTDGSTTGGPATGVDPTGGTATAEGGARHTGE